ncbi:hypothetical protein G3I29_04905, partial [Streptomyces halstedii]|nr:hypothetical protein [Streptomyces halstedii]
MADAVFAAAVAEVEEAAVTVDGSRLDTPRAGVTGRAAGAGPAERETARTGPDATFADAA